MQTAKIRTSILSAECVTGKRIPTLTIHQKLIGKELSGGGGSRNADPYTLGNGDQQKINIHIPDRRGWGGSSGFRFEM
jgi:hypothetical protein